MEIIGQKVKSKASGTIGEIRGIEGNKVLVNFVSNSVFPVDIDMLDMSDELRDTICEQFNNRQPVNTAKNKQAREPRNIQVSVELVNSRNDILNNIHIIDEYIKNRREPEYSFAIELIKKGTYFVVVKDGSDYRFYPSRFIGYLNNDMQKHRNNNKKDGRITNPRISDLLHSYGPEPDAFFDTEYRKYCYTLGFIPSENGSFGVERKYWLF